MLNRALQSVNEQTVKPYEHLVSVDHWGWGNGAVARNRLAAAAETEWLAFLDDDDAWRPQHLSSMLNAGESADLVCSLIEWTGEGNAAIHDCDPSKLHTSNWFNPSAALVRRHVFLDVGGFPAPAPPMWDDWACWIRLVDAGARYACTHDPEAAAIYNWHETNISL